MVSSICNNNVFTFVVNSNPPRHIKLPTTFALAAKCSGCVMETVVVNSPADHDGERASLDVLVS